MVRARDMGQMECTWQVVADEVHDERAMERGLVVAVLVFFGLFFFESSVLSFCGSMI
jgi:hypothetical protein